MQFSQAKAATATDPAAAPWADPRDQYHNHADDRDRRAAHWRAAVGTH